MHLAVASVNNIEILVSWNYTHRPHGFIWHKSSQGMQFRQELGEQVRGTTILMPSKRFKNSVGVNFEWKDTSNHPRGNQMANEEKRAQIMALQQQLAYHMLELEE